MTDNASTVEKSIVAELNFGEKTAKRVSWESWEFTVGGPHQIEVTNASWGFQKNHHSYTVAIEERANGQHKPMECECKADQYNDDYDCKHKVAIASIGGPVVLQAAIDAETPTVNTGRTPSQTLAEQLRADGGTDTQEPTEESRPLHEDEPRDCVTGKSGCPGPDADVLPCFDCYELPEDT